LQEYENDRQNQTIPESLSQSDYCWRKIAQNPEAYLDPGETKNQLFRYGWSGSAFAVSREGILLTNAHVASDATKQDVIRQFFVFFWGSKAISMVSAQIGGGPPGGDKDPAVLSLFHWLLQHSDAAPSTQLRLAVKFGELQDILDEVLKSGELPTADRMLKPELTASVKVLSTGEVYPGKDVAVLKVTDRVQDKMICLPIGDSDLVFSQNKIHALGFPGGVFFSDLMESEAELRVSEVPGEISTPTPMIGGWTSFAMTADINHGYSGGPVVDTHGNAIAINVAGTEITSHKIAIPINIANSYLKQAGVKPDPGPETVHWINGLKLFSEKKYTDAQKEIGQAIDLQGGRSAKWANPYVLEFYDRCRKMAGSL
jgi:serine protease Do